MAQTDDTTHLATDLSVTLPADRPGMLATAIGAISTAGINIDGYAEMDGVVHVLTPDVAAARQALDGAGFRLVNEQQVVIVPVQDRPGSAARVFRQIADGKINLRFSYLATGNRLVVAADDLPAVLAALAE